jgi:hypothetical protein
MRILLISLLCLSTSFISFCQPVNSSNKDGGSIRKWSTIQYNYEGDLNQIIKNLRKDLGKEIILKESTTSRQVLFKFKRPEWAKEKIEIFFWAFSNQDKHFITISCKDKHENDYLDPESPSRVLIVQYFENAFKFQFKHEDTNH